MNQEQELQRIQTDNSFGGGQFYGRTPNGIVELSTGAVIAPSTTTDTPAAAQNAPQSSVPTATPIQPAPAPAPAPEAPVASQGTPVVAPQGDTQQQAQQQAVTAPAPLPETYIVQPGDTLSKIASRMGVSVGSISGYSSGNPNLIRPGENLVIKRPQADATSVALGASARTQAAGTEATQVQEDGSPVPSSLDALLKTYGITKPDPTQDPVTHFVDNYTKVMKQLGLPDIKSQIESVIKEQAAVKKDMNDEIASVNNNPWLSSDSRKDRISKIKEQYTPQLQLATDQLQLYNSLFEKGTSQAQFIMGQVTADQKSDQAAYSAVVTKAIDIAMKQMEAEQSLTKDASRVLSPTEAKSLGVPFGTKAGEAYGRTVANETSDGGGTGSIERDAESVMSGTLNLQDISTKGNYRAQVAAVLKKRGEEALKSGDIYGIMSASAAYDKEPSDTFLQSMEKTLSVAGQLGTLQSNIAETATGPLVGAFRSANPWDTKAQVIKAQLNAIVPNLARGVYGEVGVLTDNDIKQYAKTIPNLRSTEDIRNAILYITVDQIRKNVEIKIKNQAAAQRDMSGYADVYRGLTTMADEILKSLPPGSAPGGKTTTGGPAFTAPSGKTYKLPY